MNKAELIAKIAEKTELTKKDTELTVNALMQTVIESLQQGETVHLSGFGVFEAKHRAARVGRNPRTKEAIEIPERTIPSFKPGKGLTDAFKKA